MAFLVDGDQEGRDADALGLDERLLRVVHGVLLLGAVAAVAVVLGTSV